MGGLTIDKMLVLAVIAVFVLGPERLPHYAHQLGVLVKRIKGLLGEAKVRAAEEMGPDFDMDWKKLDPRQYDPRRIIREALLDEDTPLDTAVTQAVTPPKISGLSLGGAVTRPGAGSGAT